MDVCIDYIDFSGNGQKVHGWAVDSEQVEIQIQNARGNIRRLERVDVTRMYSDVERDRKVGFEVSVEGKNTKNYTLLFTTPSGLEEEILFDAALIRQKRRRAGFRQGIKNYIIRIIHPSRYKDYYKIWIRQNEPHKKALLRQREEAIKQGWNTKVSIVIPLYRTNPRQLKEMIASVQNQSYEKWELCLADAGADDNGQTPNEEYVEKLLKRDSRIKYKKLDFNYGIAENTNRAIEMATGQWVAFMDHDDIISPEAVYQVVRSIHSDEEIDVIYSDQDKVEDESGRRREPLMKPDFSMDFLRSRNYISHLFVVRKDLLDTVGWLNEEYDGSQDYDLTLRCVEKARKIYHIPKVLYHWRISSASTALSLEAKPYVIESGRKAIDAHFKRTGIPAHAETTDYGTIYRIRYDWKEKPLVSILIPNKDHIAELEACIQSVFQKNDYPNYEIVIIENNSEEQETFDFYEKLQKADSRVKVIYYEGAFNYSAINNFGAKEAAGEYLLLLNNDTKLISNGFLEEMLGYAMRSDVGAVGARLYYYDDTIQHVGVVIGYGNLAGHAFVGIPWGNHGMLQRIICTQNYSAVTAACLMVAKSKFLEVGGLTEDFAVAFNDVDFCLKLRAAGYLNVYTPWAEAYHFESKSRGYEDTPEKKERFEREGALLRSRWPEYYTKGDPYYSPNLSLEVADFSLQIR